MPSQVEEEGMEGVEGCNPWYQDVEGVLDRNTDLVNSNSHAAERSGTYILNGE
jgi:hypothetical protein